MKLVLNVLIIAFSLTDAFAGEIRSKKSNEAMTLTLENDSVVITIETIDGSSSKTLTKKLLKERVSKRQTSIREGYDYASGVHTNDIFYSTEVMLHEIKNGNHYYLMPLLVFPVAMDFLYLPFKVPANLITRGMLKKDRDIINKALMSNELVEVGHTRFERFRKYFGI